MFGGDCYKPSLMDIVGLSGLSFSGLSSCRHASAEQSLTKVLQGAYILTFL